MKSSAKVMRRCLAGGLAVSAWFIILRFLLTPLRIKVLTGLLSPADYGMVTLLSMSAHGLALIFSLGGFEVWLQQLPSAERPQRMAMLGRVMLVSTFFGLLTAGAALLGWGPRAWYGGDGVTLSGGAVALLFMTFLHVQQRLYFLLGCREHGKARITQLLWGDLWFLALLPFAFEAWTAERVLWVWSGWLLASFLITWRWFPAREAWRPGFLDKKWMRWALSGIPLLPVILSEWIFRIAGQYILLAQSDAATMAFYALALNLALVGYAVGVPLVDVCMVEFNAACRNPSGGESAKVIFTRVLRLVIAVNLPVCLALVILPDALVQLLASPDFAVTARHLPWTAPLPFLMLLNLVLARLSMARGKTGSSGLAAGAGALLSLLAGIPLASTYGATGMLWAVSGGLFFTVCLMSLSLRPGNLIEAGGLRIIRIGAGTALLGLMFAGISLLAVHPLIAMMLAGIAALIVILGFKWVDIRDLAGHDAPPEPWAQAGEEP